MPSDFNKPLTATDQTAQVLKHTTSTHDELSRLKADLASAASSYDTLRRAADPAFEAIRQATAAAGAVIPRTFAVPAPLQASARGLPAPAPSRAPSPVGAPADLGRMIRQAREAMNLTQAEFADMAGVGRRFVSELENGKATLELGKVMAACAAAGLSLLVGPR